MLKWKFNEVEFHIQVISDLTKSRRILSPQSPLIHQIATRCEQKWVRDVLYESESLALQDSPVPLEQSASSQQGNVKSKAFTRVAPSQSLEKQKIIPKKMSLKDRLKALIHRPKASQAKKPADSIFDLDRGMVGLGSERRLRVAQYS